MHTCWRNPCSLVTEDIKVGETMFRISGMYDDGDRSTTEGEAPTAPVQPSFEIEAIELLVQTQSGPVPLDITKMLDDINTITWKKEAHNDLFEYFSDKMLAICRDEV